MAVAIAAMVFVIKSKGQETDSGLTAVFGFITLVSGLFLIQYLRRLR
jgi:hypothetical protein